MDRPSRRYRFQSTEQPELRFRALLTDGAEEVRFEFGAVSLNGRYVFEYPQGLRACLVRVRVIRIVLYANLL